MFKISEQNDKKANNLDNEKIISSYTTYIPVLELSFTENISFVDYPDKEDLKKLYRTIQLYGLRIHDAVYLAHEDTNPHSTCPPIMCTILHIQLARTTIRITNQDVLYRED